MNDTLAKILFLESLDLLSTYFSSRTVTLGELALGIKGSAGDAMTTFLGTIEGRHAIACARRLQDILKAIEEAPSLGRTVTRTHAVGRISGRLDVPLYLATRYPRRPPPRRLPVIVTSPNAETPENRLVAYVLEALAIQLGRAPFPKVSAEGVAASTLHDWLRARLRRTPWDTLRRRDPLEHLIIAAEHRIRKQQTGNKPAYQSLIAWTNEWRISPNKIGRQEASEVAEGLLAFPAGDGFYEKLFEIWTLKQTAESLVRCGCELVNPPRSLHQRDRGPIFRFRKADHEIHVWFQRQQPLGLPRWAYLDSGQPLSGIPDVVLSTTRGDKLIADAKLRSRLSDTRPEETYKMLGYAENFRGSFGEGSFQGILIFEAEEAHVSRLQTSEGDVLTLVTLGRDATARLTGSEYLDSSLGEWLDRIA